MGKQAKSASELAELVRNELGVFVDVDRIWISRRPDRDLGWYVTLRRKAPDGSGVSVHCGSDRGKAARGIRFGRRSGELNFFVADHAIELPFVFLD
jgi:hypothetical protein